MRVNITIAFHILFINKYITSITYRSAVGRTDDKCQQNEGSHVEWWCLKYDMQRYSFIVCYLLCNLLHQERRSTPKFSPQIVCWMNGTLPSFTTLDCDQDWGGGFCDVLLSRSTPYILFENKRPITSTSDWLWWPAKFLYGGQKCAFKANLLIPKQNFGWDCNYLAWYSIVQINQTQSENTFMVW